jgi:hypothetical protein
VDENLENEVTVTYFGDVIGSYALGVQLDLRVKLAVDFLKSPVIAEVAKNPNHSPQSLATFALDLATQLIEVAEDRGLIADMPETDGLSAPMRKHIRRQVRANVVGQVCGQQIMAEETPSIDARAPVSIVPRRQ